MRWGLVLAAGVTALTACTSGSHSSVRIYGKGTSRPLVITAASPSGRLAIDEETARRSVEHPFATSGTGRRLVFFGLGRVTADGLASEGPAPPPAYKHRLAWVGVYQLGSLGPHSCPGQRLGAVASLPPVQKHYFDAVIVDPTTGRQAFWSEDASGALLRDCGAYVVKK